MQSATIQHLAVQRSLNLTDYETEYDPECAILWGFIKPQAGPHVTLKLLEDVRKHDRLFESNGGRVFYEEEHRPVNYYVVGSRMKGVYSLGGDLAYFMQCIERRDRNALMNYATLGIDNLYPRIQNYRVPNLITIALVQGDALGGGFEGALANNVIIAEEQAKMGLPEILFNLFPGMGAYSLLARRVGPRLAEEMILSGNLYPAARLHEMGIVDMVVPEGRGEMAVYDYVNKVHKRRNGGAATYQARQAVFPITREELMKITTLWVDAALRLDERDLRMMTRIVQSQSSLKQGSAAPAAGQKQ
ncbi:MAG: crotonase/enoyl-CoA hydratase family protein, partial [Pseudomonadota bacterium]